MKKYFERELLLSSIVLTAVVMYSYNPWINIGIDQWDRTMGTAAIHSVSIGKRISNFYLFIVIIPIIWMAIWGILSIVLKEREIYKKSFISLCNIMIFPVIAAYTGHYHDVDGINHKHNAIIQNFLIFGIIFGIILLLDKAFVIREKDIYFAVASYMLGIIGSRIILQNISHLSWSVRYCHYLMGAVLLAAGVGIVYWKPSHECMAHIEYICSFLWWIPMVIYGCREILFVLNQRGFYIKNHRNTILEILFLLILVLIIWLFYTLYHKKYSLRRYEVNYWGLLCSLGVCQYFYSYQNVYDYREIRTLFEDGNRFVVMDSFRDGKLPFIDYFSAHALSDIWTRALYAFINGDAAGIVLDLYAGFNTVLMILFCFILLKQIFGADMAVLITMLFPFQLDTVMWSSVCFLSILAVLYVIKRKSFFSYILLWLALAVGVLYRYDNGMAIGVSCLLVVFAYALRRKEGVEIRKLLVSGLGVASVMLGFYLAYAIYRGISPVDRLLEWYSVCLRSSSTWATINFGDATTFAFVWSYMIIPLSVMGIFVYAFFAVGGGKTQKSNVQILLYIFILTGILFVPRMMTFHNLMVCHGSTGVLFNFYPWIIMLFVYWLVDGRNGKNERQKNLAAICALGCILYAEGIIVTGDIPVGNSSLYNKADSGAASAMLEKDFSDMYGEMRVVYSENTQQFIQNIKAVLDTLLEDDETFIDFANATGLYALVDRSHPAYVSQMPALLTDEKSQEYFIKEVSAQRAPLVVMGVDNMKYYKVAEWIYQNYVPLVHAAGLNIWCDKDKHDEYLALLKENDILSHDCYMISSGYDRDGEMNVAYYSYRGQHDYDMCDIPYLWANHDEKSAIENKEICVAAGKGDHYSFDGSEKFLLDSKDEYSGNYVKIICDAEQGGVLKLSLYEKDAQDISRYVCHMNLKPGENSYLIRVSLDYLWYDRDIDTMEVEFEQGTGQVKAISVLAGD